MAWVLLAACTSPTGMNPLDASQKDAGETDATTSILEGATRLSFSHEQLPYVTDEDADPLVPLWDGQPFRFIGDVKLNSTATAVAFCADDESGGIDAFAGPIGSVHKLYEHSLLCKNPVPSASGEEVALIEYGHQDGGPHNVLRFVDMDGKSTLGDRMVGDVQVWDPFFGDDSSEVFALFSSGNDVGPIKRYKRGTSEAETVVAADLRSKIHSRGGQIASGKGYILQVADTSTGEVREVFSFPSTPPDCSFDFDSEVPLCFFQLKYPRFDHQGRRIAFAAAGHPGLSKDSDFEIFVFDLESEELARITDNEEADTEPVFSADGSWLFWLQAGMLVRRRSDLSSPVEVLRAVSGANLGSEVVL
jgi:hypothetical protein